MCCERTNAIKYSTSIRNIPNIWTHVFRPIETRLGYSIATACKNSYSVLTLYGDDFTSNAIILHNQQHLKVHYKNAYI